MDEESRTLAQKIVDVLAFVPKILRTLIQIIVDALALVSKIVRTLIQIIVDALALVSKIVSQYFDDCDNDYDYERKNYYNVARKEKEILWRIFFSPLTRKHAFIISCIAVSIDPLFFYIPVIDEKNKCLGIDKRLKTAALCLRALPDAAFALPIIHSLFTTFKEAYEDEWLVALLVSFMSIFIGTFLILPIPQLAIVVFFFKSGGSGHFGQRVTTVNVFLVMHYLARVFLIYRFSNDLRNKTKTGVQAALYFFFYVLSSHILGGFWYFFSIQREISCWHQSCTNTVSCGDIDYCSGSTSRNITFLNELCPSNPPNATIFNFGIFLDAIQYGTTRSMHFPTKFFYCVWWGVRNLSNFGTNMQTSSYVWENCSAIIVSLIGLLLFLYLLGNLQIYMQQTLTRSLAMEELGLKILKKKEEIRWHLIMYRIPDYSVERILGAIRENELDKKIDDEVDVNYIFSILDESACRYMCTSICQEMLRKVKELQNMNYHALETICLCLKPKIFKENEMVVEAGQPLNAMLIIIAGSMQAYQPIRVAGEAYPLTSFETLDKGMFVGEQLLDWAAKTKTFDDQPISFKTIRCSKKVEAFALTVDDLKTLVHSEDIPKSKDRILQITHWTTRRKLNEIFLWMARNGISDDVAIDIIMHGFSQNKLKEKIYGEVDVNYIFSVLEEYGRGIMRRHFCMETLKKVNELQHMNDRELGTICDYLKPKVFEENAKVVEVGEPLNAMLYIIAGSMHAPITDAGEGAFHSFETLEKGMFVGEELLDWAAKTKTFDDQPVSFKTVRCSTKVEGFAFTVDDLKTLVLSGDIFPMKSKAGILKIAADQKIREKLEAIFLWMAINGISDDVAIGIMHGFSQNKLKENIHAEVDVNYIFSVLDESGRSIMRRHFCTETLKKVKELHTMNNQTLGMICDYLKPKMFEENAQVVEAGQPLNTMLYIIAGSMQAYLPIRAAGEAHPSTSFETLEKGMFVGEQLLDWAAKTKTFYDQPVSFKTIRCSKKVEAFALTVDDLKTLVFSRAIVQRSSKSDV